MAMLLPQSRSALELSGQGTVRTFDRVQTTSHDGLQKCAEPEIAGKADVQVRTVKP